MSVQARIGLFVATALVVGLVGPCLCGPTAAVSQASHGCCEAGDGLMLAPVDCCSGCSTSLRVPAAGLPGTFSPWVVLASAPCGDEPLLQQAAAPPSPQRKRPVVPSPPTILRV